MISEWTILRSNHREARIMASKSDRPKIDKSTCSKCGQKIKYKYVQRATGQYGDPEAVHTRDIVKGDLLLEKRWLSDTSVDDRREELAARCEFKPLE